MEIIATRWFLFQITNYQGFWNNRVNLYEFFLLGTKVQIKILIIKKFVIIEFWINQVLLYNEILFNENSI
jgi:hypothetical protein